MNIIRDITIGSKTVQQYDINWSNLILGKDALTHIKEKINIEVFIPKDKLNNKSSLTIVNKKSLSFISKDK